MGCGFEDTGIEPNSRSGNCNPGAGTPPFGKLEHSHQPNLMLLLAPSGIAPNCPFCLYLDQAVAHHLVVAALGQVVAHHMAAVSVAAALEECCCCCQSGTALAANWEP